MGFNPVATPCSPPSSLCSADPHLTPYSVVCSMERLLHYWDDFHT